MAICSRVSGASNIPLQFFHRETIDLGFRQCLLSDVVVKAHTPITHTGAASAREGGGVSDTDEYSGLSDTDEYSEPCISSYCLLEGCDQLGQREDDDVHRAPARPAHLGT